MPTAKAPSSASLDPWPPTDAAVRQWQELAASIPGSAFHHVPTCFEAAVRFRGMDDRTTNIATLRDTNDRLLIVVPLQVSRRRIRRFPFSCWSYPHDPDRPATDLIAHQDISVGELQTVTEALSKARSDIGLLVLDRLQEGSPSFRLLSSLPPHLAHLERNGQIIRVWTNRTYDELLAGTAQKFRAQLRRARRILAEHGPLEHRIATRPNEVKAALEIFLRMEAAGWKGRAEDGNAIALRSGLKVYVEGAFPLMAARDQCAVHSLWSGEDCVASLLVFRGIRQVHAFKISYDERWHGLSPGHSLLEHVLQHYCDDPQVDACIFGTEAAWLEKWRPERRGLWSVYVSLGWRGRLALHLLRLPLDRQGR